MLAAIREAPVVAVRLCALFAVAGVMSLFYVIGVVCAIAYAGLCAGLHSWEGVTDWVTDGWGERKATTEAGKHE